LLCRILELDPSDHEAAFWLARALDRMDRRDEAQPFYVRICSSDEETIWTFSAHRQLATHLAFRVGDVERAVDHMEEAWRITGWTSEAENLIYLLGPCERFDRIIDVYHKIQRETLHPRVHATAGVAYREMSRLEEAKQAWERALDTSDDPALEAEASLHVARCLGELGMPEQRRPYVEAGARLELKGRGTLTSGESTVFWTAWTRWLVDCLEALQHSDADLGDLLEKTREQAAA
jgi:tetratricopeptide (TPR) repeat protein